MAEEETVQIGLRVPKSMRDALEELAELQGRSLNAVAIRALGENLARHVNSYVFDKEVHFDQDRDVVFSWLRDETSREKVRVEATKEFVADTWGVRWSNAGAVEKEFRKRRSDYLEAASRAPSGGKAIRVYVIGTSGGLAKKGGKS